MWKLLWTTIIVCQVWKHLQHTKVEVGLVGNILCGKVGPQHVEDYQVFVHCEHNNWDKFIVQSLSSTASTPINCMNDEERFPLNSMRTVLNIKVPRFRVWVISKLWEAQFGVVKVICLLACYEVVVMFVIVKSLVNKYFGVQAITSMHYSPNCDINNCACMEWPSYIQYVPTIMVIIVMIHVVKKWCLRGKGDWWKHRNHVW